MRTRVRQILAGVLGALVLTCLALAHGAGAVTTATTTSETLSFSVTTTTTATPASETASSEAETAPEVQAVPTEETTSTESEQSTETTSTATLPEVSAQTPQQSSAGEQGAATGDGKTTSKRVGGTPAHRKTGKAQLQTGRPPGNGHDAPLPFVLRAPISGVPALFIESLDVPAFLLPIYQAAGIAYDIPWQVLAAINEVETDYGADLNISSAGAEGWMQFLPAEWQQYGIDATGSGWMDPYNPADAIFAAARYLQAAGGSAHIRAAVFAYNHSQAYVESVMLRAELLGAMPPDLLGELTNLAEARFPVYARSHFGDSFAQAPAAATEGHDAQTLVGTTIYSEPDAPVIAVKDGTVTALGDSPSLGEYVSLRDADGNTYTYAQLGSVASVYPVLTPRNQLKVSTRIAHAAKRPSGAASAGVQARSPLSKAAVTQDFALGAAAGLLDGAPQQESATSQAAPQTTRRSTPNPAVRSFAEGPEQVALQELRPGSQVIAGTVLGHLGDEAEAHMLFQIEPTGQGTPLIDPKPILDSWVALEDTGIFRAKGENPFLATSPTAGQALLESDGELEQQVLRDREIHLEPCERAAVQAGEVDRRVLASLELLSVTGLHPTVANMGCGADAAEGLGGYSDGDAFDITAINGTQIAGHAGPGGVADVTERKLMTLQGTMAPREIAGPIDYRGSANAITLPASQDLIHVAFTPAGEPSGASSATAGSQAAAEELTPQEWQALIERLATIPDATVAAQPSSAAVPDSAAGEADAASAGEGEEAADEAAQADEEAQAGEGTEQQ
ncbi:MAG TPA: lytic murein transglycosylase [Solirubrobacteraceae bacterium]